MIYANGRASKEAVARVVVAKYPEIKACLTQNRKWKEEFHQNMFDAVALGIVYCQIKDAKEILNR